MALSIQNNIASLVAQNNLNKSSSALNTSLQRLSSGVKINTGADGPAALVISNEQGAQIAGLQSAIDNTNQAVSLVQTSEGALSTVNDLLVQIRGLALSAANSAVNDPTSLAADQAQIQNALDTIDRISANTQFGTKKLLDGSAQDGGLTSATAGVTTSGTLISAPAATTIGYSVTTAAAKAQHVGSGGFAGAGGTIGNSDAGDISITDGTTATSVTLLATDTVDVAVSKINSALQAGGTNVVATNVGGQVELTGTNYTANITVTDGAAGKAAGIGFTSGTAYNHTDAVLKFSVNGGSTRTDTGVGNVIPLDNELSGITVTLGDNPTYGSVSSVAPTNATFTVGSKLVFQIGANEGQTASLSIGSTSTNQLGVGVVSGINSLSAINVTTSTGAQNALSVIDKAISDISSLRGQLGAFQTNTLQATASNLQTTLTNTTGAGGQPYRLLLTATQTGTANAITLDTTGLGATGGGAVRPSFGVGDAVPAGTNQGTAALTAGGAYSGAASDTFTFTVDSVTGNGDLSGGGTVTLKYHNADNSQTGTLTLTGADLNQSRAVAEGIDIRAGAGPFVQGDSFTLAATVATVQQAADASVTLGSGSGALTVTSSGNTVNAAINGVTLNLLGTSPS
jgi:flagellin